MSSDQQEAPPAAWGDLTDEQRRGLLALAETLGDDEKAEDLRSGRRGFMKALGLAGTAAVAGGAAQTALTEPAAAAHGGGTLGTSGDPLEMIHTEGLSSLDSLKTEELNEVEIVDPDATDFATALSDAESRVATNGTILVPPVEYAECSGHVLSKEVVIKSLAEFARFHHPTHPTIHKTADAPVIEGGSNMNVAVIGLNIDATGVNDTTPAIETHGQTYINHLKAEEIGGGSVVRIGQDSSGDNANLSQVLNVSAANCAGDVVLAENTTADANNINSLRVHVQDHQGNAGWAINTGQGDANASVFLVNSIQDTATNITSGGIRMNSQRCWGRVMRHEGSGPVVDFANKMNYCECLYDLSGNGATWNNPNNIWHLWGDSGWNVETRYGGYRFRGGRVQVMPDTAQPGGSSNPALKIGNGGAGFFIDVNGEVNVVDEAGNATIIS